MNESVIKISELKKRLPKQINHNTLMIILTYLEVSNKIVVSLKGITWIHNPNPRLRKAISEGLEL
jgi:exosome complex RNA-binding protein Rrp4